MNEEKKVKIIFYPEESDENRSSVKKHIDSLEQKHKKIYDLTQITLRIIEQNGVKAIDDFKKRGICKLLGNGLYELRIPKNAKGCVLRIYFQFHRFQKDTIVILDAEFKKRTKGDTRKARKNKN